jgi:hypothetical protein
MNEDMVTFRRQVSDGSYGSETIEVVLTVSKLEDLESVLMTARRIVQEELQRSPNPTIRRTMERELS